MKTTLEVTLDEALDHITDPYSLLGVSLAQRICTVFAVPFPDDLVVHWTSRADALRRFDTPVQVDHAGEGVLSSRLSSYIAAQYEVDITGHDKRTRKQQVLHNRYFLEIKLREKFLGGDNNNGTL